MFYQSQRQADLLRNEFPKVLGFGDAVFILGSQVEKGRLGPQWFLVVLETSNPSILFKSKRGVCVGITATNPTHKGFRVLLSEACCQLLTTTVGKEHSCSEVDWW